MLYHLFGFLFRRCRMAFLILFCHSFTLRISKDEISASGFSSNWCIGVLSHWFTWYFGCLTYSSYSFLLYRVCGLRFRGGDCEHRHTFMLASPLFRATWMSDWLKRPTKWVGLLVHNNNDCVTVTVLVVACLAREVINKQQQIVSFLVINSRY